MNSMRVNIRTLLLISIPLSVYVAHVALYWDWLIDDAGISIAYAHNLIAGHGFVAQAGAEPVEGFSNPLWTLVLATSMATRAFSTYWTIKLLSCALAGVAFCAMLKFCRLMISDRNRADAIYACAAVLTACCPSFAIWTSSGLENGLLVSLVLSLLWACASWSMRPAQRVGVAAGLLAGLIALTRPDGLVYAGAFPLIAIVQLRDRSAIRPTAIYSFALLAIVAPYQLFRMSYFGDVVPNTFHAKPGASIFTPFTDVASGRFLIASTNVFEAALPAIGWLCAVLFVAYPLLYMFMQKTVPQRHVLLLYLFATLAFFAYLALPQDWMPQYRFATVLIPVAALFFFHLTASLLQAASRQNVGRIIAIGATAYMVLAMPAFMDRATRFLKTPTTPLDQIANDVGLTFNWYRNQFDIQDASLLSPDIGGALMYSDLRIVDLAGLCDKDIGVLIHRNSATLRDRLLETERPTFVHVHTVWSQISGLPTDPRFLADYVRLSESNWVRRDAIAHLGEEKAVAMAAALPEFDVANARPFPTLKHARGVAAGRPDVASADIR